MALDFPVLITGAASGIGQALAARLREDGVEVVGWDLSWPDQSQPSVDVADESSVSAAASLLPPRLGAVVTCAGTGTRTTVADTSIATFRRVLDVNLLGTVAVAQAVHSRLRGGTFVALGSVAGTVPFAERSAYACSKAAVAMFVKILANEWAADDIQALCLSPGFVDAGMAVSGPDDGGAKLRRVLDRMPNGRLVALDEVVDMLVLAASGSLRGMTGTELMVDGGYLSGSRLS